MVLAAVAALVGAAVQSATGFGFALVLSPALFAVMEPAEAVTALLALGAALNLLVLVEGHDARWSRLPPLLLPALPGLVLGAVVLAALSREPLQIGVGVAVIAAALWQLRHQAAAARVPAPAAGFLSGVLTTSISISGPPIVLWLEAQALSPAEFRATLAAVFLALNVAGWAFWAWRATPRPTSASSRCCWRSSWRGTRSGPWRSGASTTSASTGSCSRWSS